jgi:hypothetical protein
MKPLSLSKNRRAVSRQSRLAFVPSEPALAGLGPRPSAPSFFATVGARAGHRPALGALMALISAALMAPGIAHAYVMSQTLNYVAVSAQSVHASSPHSSGPSGTSNGLGLGLSAIGPTGLFTQLDLDYGLSNSQINKATLFNLRAGQGFLVAPDLMLGPYVGYQHITVGSGASSSGNDAVGLGLYAAMVSGGSLTLSGYLGALAGMSASNGPKSNVVQAGAKLDYKLDASWSAFIGLNYDRYTGSDVSRTGLSRGQVGVAYHY